MYCLTEVFKRRELSFAFIDRVGTLGAVEVSRPESPGVCVKMHISGPQPSPWGLGITGECTWKAAPARQCWLLGEVPGSGGCDEADPRGGVPTQALPWASGGVWHFLLPWPGL